MCLNLQNLTNVIANDETCQATAKLTSGHLELEPQTLTREGHPVDADGHEIYCHICGILIVSL
jgi:hypothetical protein